MPNRLANETSPYLLQHKDNPVDWYPWGEEAFARAKAEDKAILLSVGYSACHWCHVMAHESFEDPQTAAVMNALFVNIKVDREERPDVDSIYMQAVQTMTGHGGWPMTVFMTPDGRPFYGGTYFPPVERHGMPSFTQILMAVADAYQNRRGEMLTGAAQITERLQRPLAGSGQQMLTATILQAAAQRLAGGFDWDSGGFGSAPKFPQPMNLEFLLRSYKRDGNARLLQMAEFTLDKMARGGMYDQVGGGFHRYSTDAHWLVPHFEKMLYDNALLIRTYLHAYQITGADLFRRIAVETADYVLREMTDPAGGFYSAQDADSEGHEGRFFLWTPEEITTILGEADARIAMRVWDVTEEGNFEGKNILNVPTAVPDVAISLGITEADLMAVIQRCREKLYAARERRIHPGRDDKALTSWNGLMLQSLTEAAAVLERDDYLQAARKNGEFLLRELRREGRVLRTWKSGEAKIPGFLEDYAMLASGLTALYEATFERRWLDEAANLCDGMVELFWSEAESVFYDTGRDAEALIMRPRDFYDNAMPSGGSAAAEALLKVAVLTGRQEFEEKAVRALRGMAGVLGNYPSAFGHWLCALDFYLGRKQEIVLVGAPTAAQVKEFKSVVFGAYLPNKVVAGFDPKDGAEAAKGLPLLDGRGLVEGKPAAYVCENYACQLPATDVKTLKGQLGVAAL
ncbi:MAG: thioredoxin domain-containing protein [Chloroflexi bacterium]|nr:thioredoxin domain-containing protein [Chloroflexota bacterium]